MSMHWWCGVLITAFCPPGAPQPHHIVRVLAQQRLDVAALRYRLLNVINVFPSLVQQRLLGARLAVGCHGAR